jgi:hypothetical protein
VQLATGAGHTAPAVPATEPVQLATGAGRTAPAVPATEPVLVLMLVCLARCQSANATLLAYQAAGYDLRVVREPY